MLISGRLGQKFWTIEFPISLYLDEALAKKDEVGFIVFV